MIRIVHVSCALLLLAATSVQAENPKPWIDVARIIFNQQKASAAVIRSTSVSEIAIHLLRDPVYRQGQLALIRETWPEAAMALEREIATLSPQRISEIERQLFAQIDEAAMQAAMDHSRPKPNCDLKIGGRTLGLATLYATGSGLKRLVAAKVITCGKGFEPLRPTREPWMHGVTDERTVVLLDDPPAFKALYELASRGKLERCSTLGQICVGNRGVTFSMGCGEGIGLQASTEGSVSVTFSAKSREATLTVVE